MTSKQKEVIAFLQDGATIKLVKEMLPYGKAKETAVVVLPNGMTISIHLKTLFAIQKEGILKLVDVKSRGYITTEIYSA